MSYFCRKFACKLQYIVHRSHHIDKNVLRISFPSVFAVHVSRVHSSGEMSSSAPNTKHTTKNRNSFTWIVNGNVCTVQREREKERRGGGGILFSSCQLYNWMAFRKNKLATNADAHTDRQSLNKSAQKTYPICGRNQCVLNTSISSEMAEIFATFRLFLSFIPSFSHFDRLLWLLLCNVSTSDETKCFMILREMRRVCVCVLCVCKNQLINSTFLFCSVSTTDTNQIKYFKHFANIFRSFFFSLFLVDREWVSMCLDRHKTIITTN